MEAVTERFLELYNELLKREYFKNPADFARQTDLKPSAINEILKGRSNVGLKIIQHTVLKYEDVDLDWWIRGHGSMFKEEYQANIAADYHSTKKNVSPDINLPATVEALHKTIQAQQETIDSQKVTIKSLEAVVRLERQSPEARDKHPAPGTI